MFGSFRDESNADQTKVLSKQSAEKRKQGHQDSIDSEISDIETVAPPAAKKAKQLHLVSYSALPECKLQGDNSQDYLIPRVAHLRTRSLLDL